MSIRTTGISGNERLTAFSDGVFSIAMTLLVFSIQIPDLPAEQVAEKLPQLLWGLVPKFLSFIVSFIILGIYWIGHHTMYMHIRRHDRLLLWINLLFLMFIASMPLPAALLIRYSDQKIIMVIYCIFLIMTGIVADLMWWYASKDRRLMSEDTDPAIISLMHRRVRTAPVIYLFAMFVSFLNITIAKLMLVGIILFYIAPTVLDEYHHRQLNKHPKSD